MACDVMVEPNDLQIRKEKADKPMKASEGGLLPEDEIRISEKFDLEAKEVARVYLVNNDLKEPSCNAWGSLQRPEG